MAKRSRVAVLLAVVAAAWCFGAAPVQQRVNVTLLPNGDVEVGTVNNLAAWMLRMRGGVTEATCRLDGWVAQHGAVAALAWPADPDDDWSGAGHIGTVIGTGEVYDLELCISPPDGMPYAATLSVRRPDVDRNGVLGVTDFVLVRMNLGKVGDDINPPGADVDGNGVVNITDLMIVRSHLGV